MPMAEPFPSSLVALSSACCLAILPASALPAAPATITPVPSSQSGEVTLSWTAVPGATGYTVRRGTSPAAVTVPLGTVTTTTFTDLTATPGNFSYYTVNAKLEFTYIRNKAALQDGISFSVQYSDLLTPPWTSVGPGTVTGDDGTVQTLHAQIPAGAAGRRFVRLGISQP